MSLTYAQKFSFCETIEEILELQKDEITAAGLDAGKKKAEVGVSVGEARKKDAAQEILKAELGKATEAAVKALDAAYLDASSATDAIVGVLKKDSKLSQRLRKLREEMKRQEKAKKE